MAVRAQAAPRQRDDRPLMPVRVEAQDDVDRGQPGADDEDRCVLCQPLLERRRPGIADIAVRRQMRARHRGRIVRRQIADRQHRAVGLDQPAVDEAQRHLPAALGDIEHLVVDQLQPPAMLFHRRRQRLAQIAAIGRARHERRVAAEPTRRQPVAEMVGPVGKGAHIARAHIEQVRTFAAAVRDPRTHAAPVALDQQHLDIGLFEQVEREHRPRKARADDRDTGRGAKARARRMELGSDQVHRVTTSPDTVTRSSRRYSGQ